MELKLYQRDAVSKLKNGSILCGDVGSGKSLTSLAYFFCKVCGGEIEPDFKPMKKPRDLYIITTAVKRDRLEWDKEMLPFRLTRNKELDPHGVNVTIDSWNNIKKYVNVYGAFFIFDEQRVVGSGAWVKAFYKITKKNQWILLSATPGDTWSDYIPVFVANGFYKNKTEFLQRHAVYNRYSKYPKIDRYIEQSRLLRFRNEILVKMRYRRPAIAHNEVVPVSYDKLLYKTIVRKRWNLYENVPIKNVSELCYLMRKCINSDESRQTAVLELLEKHPRAIIFYNHDYELEILKSLMYPKGTVVAELNGHVHEKVPTSDKWVYLVNYASGAEGWNCVETNAIIFYSQTYSYKTLKQASGRIDRMNTPFKDLYYYHLKSTASIDMAISECLAKKKNFNESAFAA